MNQLFSLEEITLALKKSMLPYTCECIASSEISIDIRVTIPSDPPQTLTVPGVYLPSLQSTTAIERLSDEIHCLLVVNKQC
jgi:hypothetical protein